MKVRVSYLCPLVVFLCTISQTCCGTQADLSPQSDPKLPCTNAGTDQNPQQMTSKFRRSPMSPNNLEIRLDSMTSVNNYRSKTKIPFQISQATSSLNTRLEPTDKSASNSRQGLSNKQNSNLLQRNIVNTTKELSTSKLKANAKPRLGTALEQKNQFPSKLHSSLNGTTYPSTGPVSVIGTKSHSKQKSSIKSISNTKPESKISEAEEKSPIKANRNQSRLLDSDKDSQTPRRGWIWNQFFVLEEHIGPELQYVGKVR